MSRISVVTSGHLSTCPRMVKAADALARDGHDVHVVSTQSTPWAREADETVRKGRRGLWRWTVVDYGKDRAPLTYALSGGVHHLGRIASRYSPSLPFSVGARALSRAHGALARAARATNADFFYGGTVGGMGPCYAAATRAGRPYALDLEDFYSGVHPDELATARSVDRVESEVLNGARFLTAGSDAIAEAYRRKYGVDAVAIHNTFPLPSTEPAFSSSGDRLKLYWFSQTIGPGRGIEDAIEGVGLAGVPGELHLRGDVEAEFRRNLESLAAVKAPALEIAVHAPAPPDDMVRLLDGYDVGLALEQNVSENGEIALSNKVFTYLLGGLALVVTRTTGHRPIVDDLKDHAVAYAPGDLPTLAAGLKRLATDRAYLEACRRASWKAAVRRWHWEHEDERGRLVSLFR